MLNKSGLTKMKYWNYIPKVSKDALSFDEATEEYMFLLKQSVERRLRSDVPVGTSLSGGIDSSSIVHLVSKFLSPQNRQCCFSARFNNQRFDEGAFMSKAVENLKTINRKQIFIEPADYWSNIEKLYYHQEEPIMGPSAFVLWQVMSIAKQNNILVLLDGQGADEILAGYHKYFNSYLREVSISQPFLYNKIKKEIGETTGNHQYLFSLIYEKQINMFSKLNLNRLSGLKSKGFNLDLLNGSESFINPFKVFNNLNDALWFDTKMYGLNKLLRMADRNAMAFSVEVRLPFLSHKLIEFLFSLPSNYKIQNGFTKYIHRKGFEKTLPSEICWRSDKMGPLAPYEDWLHDKNGKERIAHYIDILVREGLFTDKMNISEIEIVDLGAFVENSLQF
jgi:asparagine synthase (glutamine-hydrolysing)